MRDTSCGNRFSSTSEIDREVQVIIKQNLQINKIKNKIIIIGYLKIK